MALNFTEDTIPTTTVNRSKRDNPFHGMFPLPEGKAVSSVIPFHTDDEKTAAEVLKRDAQAAGRAAGVTTRVKIEHDGKSKTAKMILWNVPAIKRERKEKPAEAEKTTAKK